MGKPRDGNWSCFTCFSLCFCRYRPASGELWLMKSRLYLAFLAMALALLGLTIAPLHACTIFVLTDAHRALFFNNEDWSNPHTRLWFIPAGAGHHGCAYVGFDDGWTQGGLNTEGLAFDWVAGGSNRVDFAPQMRTVRGNPSQRMLETCATVEDAITFYRQYREVGFSTARILVADRTGASAIIGVRDGRLTIDRSTQCRGFGYGRRTLDQMLARPPEPTLSNGVNILRACVQKGQYPTRYSTAYDLKSAELFLFDFAVGDDFVKLNLREELKKGAHYYDLPQLRAQRSQPARPLLVNMGRFPFDERKEIPDREPLVTARLRALVQDATRGVLRSNDFSAALWKEIKPDEVRDELKVFGTFLSLTLVERNEREGQPSYLYRLQFSHGQVLQRYALDADHRLTFSHSEAVELDVPQP